MVGMEATAMEATGITVLDMEDTTPATATMATPAMAMDILGTVMAIAAMVMATHRDSSMGDLSRIVVLATMADSEI